MSETSPTVLLERDVADGVALVTIDRQDVHNALDGDAKAALGRTWAAIDADRSVRAVVLRGAGESAFCAGSDLKEIHRTGRTVGTDVLLDALPGLGVPLRQPVVSALQGHTIGMGFTLALHTDVRIAHPGTRIRMPEVAHGALSALTAMRLPDLIGHARAAEVLLEGRTVDAATALSWGLLNDVAADPVESAVRRAAGLAAQPEVAVQQTLRLMRSSWRAQVAASRELVDDARRSVDASDALASGAAAFSAGAR